MGTFKNPNTLFHMADIDAVIRKCVDDIWAEYDKDNSGALDKEETKKFVQNTLSEMTDSGEFSDADFEACSKEFVQISLSEMSDSGEFSDADFEACFKEFDKD